MVKQNDDTQEMLQAQRVREKSMEDYDEYEELQDSSNQPKFTYYGDNAIPEVNFDAKNNDVVYANEDASDIKADEETENESSTDTPLTEQQTEMQTYNNGFARAIDNIANVFGDSEIGSMLHNIASSVDSAFASKEEKSESDREVREDMDREVQARGGVGEEEYHAGQTMDDIHEQAEEIRENGSMSSKFDDKLGKSVEQYPVRTGKMIKDFEQDAMDKAEIAAGGDEEKLAQYEKDIQTVTGGMTGSYYGKLKSMEKDGVEFTDEERWMIDENKPETVDVAYSGYEKDKPLYSEKQKDNKQTSTEKSKEDEYEYYSPEYSDEELEEYGEFADADKEDDDADTSEYGKTGIGQFSDSKRLDDKNFGNKPEARERNRQVNSKQRQNSVRTPLKPITGEKEQDGDEFEM